MTSGPRRGRRCAVGCEPAVGDIDVVLLDSDTAGCVSTWLSNGGHLDIEGTRILAACVKDLDAVLAMFTDGEEQHYLQQVRILADAVLAKGGT